MKYGRFTLGQVEAILNKVVKAGGGNEGVLDKMLSDTVEFTMKVISYIVATYTQAVKYSASIEQLVKVGNYDWVNENITTKTFPVFESDREAVELTMFHFNRSITSEDAIAGMKMEGFRPATMKELLSFGEKHPEIQREYPVVTLGSVVGLGGGRFVGYLYRYGSERYAHLDCFDGGWCDVCRFLAVRN